ncbi:methyltransferase [Catovirus CTV1]|uniref:Methyltransferase n=1 Tax=Catovirus CTV1 TaxID=1977631 RepID=A0A1V0SAE3_9VIRU|nr:methyltransferase [Catovirus CTV1]
MFESIRRLKNNGYTPKVVLDVGAHHGSWTKSCLEIYPDASYYLFEPHCYNQLSMYDNSSNVKIHNVLLSDKIEAVKFYAMGNTGDSIFKEKSKHFVDCPGEFRITTTIDNIFAETENVMENILLKIDCQGAEIPILKGCTSILDKTDFIILELPFFGQYNENVPNFLEHIKFMDDIGFIPFDISEIHFVKNFTMQVDIMFISKKHEFNNNMAEKLFT